MSVKKPDAAPKFMLAAKPVSAPDVKRPVKKAKRGGVVSYLKKKGDA